MLLATLHALALPHAPSLSRRAALACTGGTLAFGGRSQRAHATSGAPPLTAAWTATDGFSDGAFITFDEGAYKAMVDDEARTPLFEKAIQKRLQGREGELVVLDIGTGPFAILALIAARAGAKKVYAIEASPQAAALARKAVKGARDVPAGTIEVIEGFSTEVKLPEKADLVVAEIIGSIASEEGLHATIRDAQARHVKEPSAPGSFIPARCQTYAAPASYALHYVLGPPEFDWTKLKEPVRLNCRGASHALPTMPPAQTARLRAARRRADRTRRRACSAPQTRQRSFSPSRS
eukprot:7226942-Prymnesium_polylepis.1